MPARDFQFSHPELELRRYGEGSQGQYTHFNPSLPVSDRTYSCPKTLKTGLGSLSLSIYI